MAKMIRKQIDLTDETVKGLKILAAVHDSNPKKYIENLVAQHVRINLSKVVK